MWSLDSVVCLSHSAHRIAYLIPPTSDSVSLIAAHCEVDTVNHIKRTRLIIFVPQETHDMRYLLESKGLAGHQMCVTGLSLGWITLDADLVSLNLPTLYADYFLFGDYTWPHFMGTELGRLLESACDSDLAPMGCRVHAFGEAANVVASGVRLHCIRSGLVKRVRTTRSETIPRLTTSTGQLSHWDSQLSMGSSQDTSSSDAQLRPPPLVIVFSRDLDYVTPMLLPVTFEALIHEILGIELGIVTLSDPSSNEAGPRKQFLNGSKMYYYRDARDVHIAHIYTLLNQWRTNLQEKKATLEAELASRTPNHNGLPPLNTGPGASMNELKALSAQVGPLLARRRELTLLLLALEKIMDALTRRECVEDIRAAQTILLRSGSGGSLAATNAQALSDDSNTAAQANEGKNAATTAAGGTCGTAADDLNLMPLRMVIEWLSTHRGDRLIDGIRLAALASVTHDGVADDTYTVLHRAVLHAAGQAAFPMLLALRNLRLLAPRNVYASEGSNGDHRISPSTDHGPGSTTTTANNVSSQPTPKSGSHAAVALSAAVARLGLSPRRKSLYNRLHHLLRLSHSGQTNRRVDQPPVSPTYVYSGQHCPIVVRLAESVWSAALTRSTSGIGEPGGDSAKSTPRSTDPEIIAKPQLISALKLLGLSEEASHNLGLVSFADPSLAASGYQTEAFNHAHRLNAPLAKPLPCLPTDQPVVVVFPGGCTYGEVAALRFVAARRRWHLLIATSALLTSRDLLQQAGQAICCSTGGDVSESVA